MIETIGFILLLIFSFFILIKASDYLISSSSILGRRAGISKFVIGLTLIAIGTSLPEFFTAIIALFSSNNSAAFVLGTVIGSNIANILLVFAILISFSDNFKIRVKFFDIFYLSFSTIILIGLIFLGYINFLIGLIYIILFVAYLYISVKKGSKKEFEEEVSEVEDIKIKKKSNLILSGIFFISLIGLNFGAKGVVISVENLGRILSIPLEFLTLTTVAFATSLPEIVVTYSAAKKSEFDLAVGNIIGSNISNIFFVLGSVGLIKSISFNPSLYYMSLIILSISTLLFIYMLKIKKVNKNYGLGLFCIYFIYLFLIY